MRCVESVVSWRHKQLRACSVSVCVCVRLAHVGRLSSETYRPVCSKLRACCACAGHVRVKRR